MEEEREATTNKQNIILIIITIANDEKKIINNIMKNEWMNSSNPEAQGDCPKASHDDATET